MRAERIRATAIVVTAADGDPRYVPAGEESEPLFGIDIGLLGSTKWEMELEVHPPGGAPYRVHGKWKHKKRLGGLRHFFTGWEPLPGLSLPVLIDSDDPMKVEVDWDAFAAGGGIEEAAKITEAQRAERSSRAVAQHMRSNPKLQAQQRASALQVGLEMARQVPTGVRPAHEFELWLSGLVDGGALTAEEGAALRSEAGLLG